MILVVTLCGLHFFYCLQGSWFALAFSRFKILPLLLTRLRLVNKVVNPQNVLYVLVLGRSSEMLLIDPCSIG